MFRTIVCLAAIAAATACSDATTSIDNNAAVDECPTTSGLAVGAVLTGLSGTNLCFSGAAAGEFALVPFNAATTSSATTSLSFTLNGTSTPTTSLATLVASGNSILTGARTSVTPRLRAFEQRLRGVERTSLPRLMAPARTWRAQRRSASASGARFSIAASATVDQLVRLNANSESACASADYRTGRIMAISDRAIVVADTSNPAGGFTSSDYASIAAAFDTLIDPVDRANFGDPTDIDENGHVVLFFTRAVNELTPKNSTSYVGGFFFARDLFPTAGAGADVCAGSNVGEMFYLMVPDPSGSVNNNVFSKTEVSEVALSTVGHEYQHLINASRRIYINDASDWEEGWLDEGLSHIAEELLFYKASGLSTGANLDATTLRSSARYVSAVNEYQISNLARYAEYLARPAKSSPYAADDSLWSRGASWSFLRYLADRRGGDQPTIWKSLVNNTVTGIPNLTSVFGGDIATSARDWALSVLTDDLVATSLYTQPSWNYRSIYPAMGITSFPLATLSPAADAPTSVTLDGGGAAYLRFVVAQGQKATIAWSTLPSTVSLSLVRVR